MTTPGSHGPGEQPPSGGSGWGPPAGGQQPGSVPPPPPGSFPQGQYPPPQGQPPGQYPQGQYPQGQFPQGQFAQGPGFPPPQQSKGGAGKWIAIIGGVVVVVVVAIVAFALIGGATPDVGDCLREDGLNLATVDCGDSEAAWRLVGIQEGTQTQEEYIADPNTCSEFPESTQYFWIGDVEDADSEGEVYCVTAV
jgi:hypothetical protein